MKVAIIIPRIDQFGPIKLIQYLVNQLWELDNLQISVFYLDKIVDSNIKMKVPVERLDSRRFRFSDYDIIHTNGIRPDLFAFINRRKIKYHISTIHNLVFEDLSFTYNRFVSWVFGTIWLLLLMRADKLVCVSKSMKNYYEKWFSSTKLEVIYNGITEKDDSYVPDYDVIKKIEEFHTKGLKVIGCTGVLTRRKGIDQILHFIASENELGLIVIGAGKELSNLQRLAKKLDITERCLFCGFKTNAVTYFKHFDLLVVPSRSEGFGLTMIEAVQQKVPVICSDLKVFNELFESNEVTFYKLDNLNSLTESLKESAEKGNGKAELAYQRYLTNYTAAIMAKKYCDLYKSASLNKVIS